MVVEKTLMSPLDCKETQPIHPKGDQPWVFIGRTDAEAEISILWPPHMKSWLPGSSPNGSRVIWRWGRSWHPGKNLFNYRYRGRLETDSVVELVEKRGWITGLHGIPITIYVGHRHLSIPIPEAQAELAGLVSTHISDGNSARKAGARKATWGNQAFQKLIQFLYFSGLFIYLFVIHRDKFRVMRGSADLTLVTIRCFI